MTDAFRPELAAKFDQAIGALRRDLSIDRLSLAQLNDAADHFEILASAGKPLLFAGLQVPISSSSQIDGATRRSYFVESDFRVSSGWDLPVDQLMLDLGFASGCSLRIGQSAYIVSLSSTDHGISYDKRLAVLEGLSGKLADLLPVVIEPTHIERVLVCTDDPIIGHGLAYLFARRNLLTAHCSGIEEAVEAATLHPTALIVCTAYFNGQPVDSVAAELRRAGVQARLLVIAPQDTAHARTLAARAGAIGYANLTDAYDGIVTAVAEAAHGAIQTLPCLGVEKPAPLSRREGEILLDIDEGLRFKQIAVRRGIAQSTAKTYARSLFAKLEVHSGMEAVNVARSVGLLDFLRGPEHGPGQV